MIYLSRIFIALFALTLPAYAQDVGIKFAEMPVGTTLVTDVLSSRPFQRSEKYVGKQGEFYVVENSITKSNGITKLSSTDYYDMKGRLVRLDREKGFEAYTPYSCRYVIGECEHSYEYPNPFKDYRQTKNTRKYSTRLDGKMLIVSWKLANGEIAEAPFELGPYNLRVSNIYRNRLGKKTGYKFVELIEPGKGRRE